MYLQYTSKSGNKIKPILLQTFLEHLNLFLPWMISCSFFVFSTSARLLSLRSSVLSRALFSRPSTLVRWLCEQLRWRRVYTSISPLVLISSLWSSDSLCSLLTDSSPAGDETQWKSTFKIIKEHRDRLQEQHIKHKNQKLTGTGYYLFVTGASECWLQGVNQLFKAFYSKDRSRKEEKCCHRVEKRRHIWGVILYSHPQITLSSFWSGVSYNHSIRVNWLIISMIMLFPVLTNAGDGVVGEV